MLVREKIRVGVLGTPLASGNRGVHALVESLVYLCGRISPNYDVTIFGSHRGAREYSMTPDGSAKVVKVSKWRLTLADGFQHNLLCIVLASFLYRLIPLQRLRSWLARNVTWIGDLIECDFVGDIRGGDSFSDIYGLKRFVVASLPVLSVVLVKGTLVHFPQTYGPFKSMLAKAIARYLLRRSSAVIARDSASQAFAQQLLGGFGMVAKTPDVAFALTPVEPNLSPSDFTAINSKNGSITVGVNVNGLMYNGGYNRGNMFNLQLDYRVFVHDLVVALCELPDVKVILVPHTIAPAKEVESDNEACRILRESFPNPIKQKVEVLLGDYNCHEVKWIIGRCDFFIGSRMHACIAALSQAVPCVGVAYSMKFKGVFETVGVSDHIVDARGCNCETAIKWVLRCFEKRKDTRHVLAVRAVAARDALIKHFSALENFRPI